MNKQNQWLFEAPPISEGDRYGNSHASAEWEWESESVVLKSPRFQGDPRLQQAVNNSPPLRIGERGAAVQKLQQALLDLKFPMPITTKEGTKPPDGIYGKETLETVKQFQEKYGLKVDGIAGRETLGKLDQLFTGQPPTPTSDRWLNILGGKTKVRSGNQVQFLIDGTKSFDAMVKAIKTTNNARHYIYLLGWWLTDCFPLIGGDPNSTIAKLFAEASRKGVQIRVMLWDQWGTQNSAEVKRINALSTGGAILDNDTLNFGSHHQKVLVVKGTQGLIGFCGGVDINPDRVVSNPKKAFPGCFGSGSGSSNKSVSSSGGISSSSSGAIAGAPLHDVHCQIRGPAARDLLDVFIQRWNAHPNHIIIDKAKGPLMGLREPVPRSLGNHAVRIGRTLNLLTPSKCIKARSVRSITVAAIRAARKFIYIEDQYLVSMEAAVELQRALPHIQYLTIVIPHSDISDLPQVWARRKAFIDLLKRGPHGHKVRVFYLVNPTSGGFGPFTYVHAKMWIVDDELAIIGSANCNRRGWSHDSEILAAIYDSFTDNLGLSFARQLRMALWAKHLNVAPGAVTDGVASAGLWLTPPAGAWVRPYNQNSGKDPVSHSAISWDSIIDPSGDSIPSCAGGVETEGGVPVYTVSQFV